MFSSFVSLKWRVCQGRFYTPLHYICKIHNQTIHSPTLHQGQVIEESPCTHKEISLMVSANYLTQTWTHNAVKHNFEVPGIDLGAYWPVTADGWPKEWNTPEKNGQVDRQVER